jgi:IclR family transcriptional regulator, pca regulon regulatory protein
VAHIPSQQRRPVARASRPADAKDRRDADSLQSLERGLAALSAFGPGRTALSLSDVARLTGMTRASARRILLTFQSLGYLRSDGRYFSPTPKVLDLGWAYVSSLRVESVARPLMQRLVDELHESVSLMALDAPDVVYVSRVHTPRVLMVPGGIGARLPAAATSAGRVLLADLRPRELDQFLRRKPLAAHTHRTVVDETLFRSLLASVKRRGWALADEELELGLRAIAAPVHDETGRVAAALSFSSSTTRATLEDLEDRCLPPLLATAEEISSALCAGEAA